MSDMVQDLKAIGQDVSEKEQALIVIRAHRDENEYWRNFKIIMAHNENV